MRSRGTVRRASPRTFQTFDVGARLAGRFVYSALSRNKLRSNAVPDIRNVDVAV